MRLVFVNIMHELHWFDSAATISQPPVPLGVLNTVTPKDIETALLDEQTERVRFDGDVFPFSVATQYARKVYHYAGELRAAGKKVILGGVHVTVCPEEAMRHADAIVTGEAELLWPTVCEDLLAGRLKEHYHGWPTPPAELRRVDYRFLAGRPYLDVLNRQILGLKTHFAIEKDLSLWLKEGATQTVNPQSKGHRQ